MAQSPKSVFDAQPQSYGERHGGAGKKGRGYFGPMLMRDGSGDVATEISIGVNLNGKEVEIPTLVPGLSKSEIDHLLKYGNPTEEIVRKAVEHARKRMEQGKNPFAGDGEDGNVP